MSRFEESATAKRVRGRQHRRDGELVLDTFPTYCQTRIAQLTERREHSDHMRYSKADAYELAAYEALIEKMEAET